MRWRRLWKSARTVARGLLERISRLTPPPNLWYNMENGAEPMGFKMVAPVRPERGTRGVDAYGAGGFGAPRGGRKHHGLDFVSVPGDHVVAPCGGVITHIGRAYADSTLGSVHIKANDGQHYIKLLYVACGRKIGDVVGQGDPIGSAEDVAGYWELKAPRGGKMTNHVHCELSSGGLINAGGMPLDPALHLQDV